MRTRNRGLTTWLILGACSVFPDRAVLPDDGGSGGRSGASGDGGASGSTAGGVASGVGGTQAGAGDSGARTMGGAGAGAGSDGLGGASAGVGGVGGDTAGSAGTGGELPCAGATELRLGALSDAYLSAEQTRANYGKSATLAVASTPGAEAHALVAFDLSEVPADANVGSAELELSLRSSVGEPRSLGAYALSRVWREDKASWLDATPSAGWTRPGGDAASLPSDTRALSLGTPAGVRLTWDVSVDVRLDVAAGAPGFGWLIRDTAEAAARIEFASREASLEAERPELVILLCP